jgi:hypothetical protein
MSTPGDLALHCGEVSILELVNTELPSYVSTAVFLFPNVRGLRHRGVVVAEIAVVNK